MEGLFEEFFQLVNDIPVEDLDPLDQFAVLIAFMEMIEKVKPIYQKYLFKDNVKKTFLMRIHNEEEWLWNVPNVEVVNHQ